MTPAEELAESQAAWEHALEDLLAVWVDTSATQREQLADQVEQVVASGDLAGLADLEASYDDAGDDLASAMEDLAVAAAEAMAAVAAAATGVEVAAGVVDVAELTTVAVVVAGLLAAGLAVSAGQEALRHATPGRPASEVADAVEEHLAGLSDASLRTHLGGALSLAQARGRFATLEVVEVEGWEADESNDDRNRCGPCAEEDGTEFETLADALEVYGNGTYVWCKGRWRCRGSVVPVFAE